MSNNLSASGIVFKKEDVLETGINFYIYTKEFGKIKIFAKSIKKIESKLKSNIDIFYYSKIEFVQGKDKKTLTDVVKSKKFFKIILSPKRFEIATKISKTLEYFLIEQEKDEKIFELVKSSFDILNSDSLEKKNCDMVYYYFLWRFFSILGFKPELYKCANCFANLKPYKNYFSCIDGGIICSLCSKNYKKIIEIDSNTIKTLRLVFKQDWQTFSKLKIDFFSKKTLQEISEIYSLFLLNK